jgi:hypothetical protein
VGIPPEHHRRIADIPPARQSKEFVMTHNETRKYEMLVRVREFGEAHRDLFPASTKGAVALATVAEAVTKLTDHADSKNQSAEAEKQVKTAARETLLNRLRAISRTARMIGRETPGFQNRFRLPKPSKQTDQSILSSGRNFCKEAAAEKARFLELGMRDTFVEDLGKLVETFGAAILDHEAGRDDQTAAQAGITSALTEGLEAVKTLDTIVANQLQGNPVVMAVWERDRKVDHSRRTRKSAASTPPPAKLAAPVEALPPAAAPVVIPPHATEAGVPAGMGS